MIHFFESTWFLWWIFAVVVIIRWFHVVAVVNQDWEETTEFVFEKDLQRQTISRPLRT